MNKNRINNIEVIEPITLIHNTMKKIKLTATTHLVKDKEWMDEAGIHIPVNRITKAERLMERSSAKLLKEALTINERLAVFKDTIRDLSQEVYDAYMDEKTTNRETKGNFTWFNFNRSIKIEVSVNQPIQFDELAITKAKQKFDTFLDANITSKNVFVKEMVINAFETQRKGNLDVKSVMNLTRYESKVKDPLFSEAVALINSAIRRPKTKTYFRVWQKNSNGEYQNVDLNISSI